MCSISQFLFGWLGGFFLFLFFFFFFLLFGGHSWLGVESLSAYAYSHTWDLSYIYDLHHNSWQHWILNPLSKARDWTHIFMDTSQVRYHWATAGTPLIVILTCISLFANDVKYVFMCLCVICRSSLVKYLFIFYLFFQLGVFLNFFFLLLYFESSLSDMWLANISSCSVDYLFNLLTGSCDELLMLLLSKIKMLLILMKSNLSIF